MPSCFQREYQTRSNPVTRVDGGKRVSMSEPNSRILPITSKKPVYFTKEFKVVALRQCLLPDEMKICDQPQLAVDYWRLHIATHPYFNPECECLVVLMLNVRKRVRGDQIVSMGTMNTVLVEARAVFRAAVIVGAAGIVVMHNHQSGEPHPSDADVKVTHDLIRAGQVMQIEVVDRVIIGNGKHCSLRELGHFS